MSSRRDDSIPHFIAMTKHDPAAYAILLKAWRSVRARKRVEEAERRRAEAALRRAALLTEARRRERQEQMVEEMAGLGWRNPLSLSFGE